MNELFSIQLKERIGGTVLRLGWLVGVATFVPTLFYLLYWTVTAAKIFYMILLILAILATVFLILLNENFRNAFSADFADIMPVVQKVYSAYNVAMPILFISGVALAAVSIILSLKAKNGKVSRKRFISSIALLIFLCLGLIVFYSTRSAVEGAVV